ncbi:hypothetical protein F2P81_007347 [Scophthalmus maximus]|uniref:Uncharacterized protein n=1 Tax=Scophthalmus maximus TaxID=52904 RepID=A0A6A4T9B7_SCOMX|nr:hypothetical protein F2P81_007347 [Scophthalmus maximus]
MFHSDDTYDSFPVTPSRTAGLCAARHCCDSDDYRRALTERRASAAEHRFVALAGERKRPPDGTSHNRLGTRSAR